MAELVKAPEVSLSIRDRSIRPPEKRNGWARISVGKVKQGRKGRLIEENRPMDEHAITLCRFPEAAHQKLQGVTEREGIDIAPY